MDRVGVIADIVDLEWEMFSSVENVGGRADCQNDPETFRIMRSSQCQTWADELLASYLEDLQAAKECGRNLMTEKYARMMEDTYPEEYARLAPSLPEISAKALEMIAEILKIHRGWQEELKTSYPKIISHMRPASLASQANGMTPLETYLRGELQTYSEKTLAIYLQKTLEKVAHGQNEAQENLLNQVKQYGFVSLEECEAKLSTRLRSSQSQH